MNILSEASELKHAGLFRDALSVLDKASTELLGTAPARVLKAELLEAVGRRREAEAIASRLLHASNLAPEHRSTCDFVLARIAIDRNEFRAGETHLTRSIASAQRAADYERLCAAQLKLVLLLADGAGVDAIGPLLAEIRANAVRTGNPRTLATVHLYFAQIEGLRGATITSRRHIALARQLLQATPNAWLEAMASNVELSLALLESEFEAARYFAHVGFQHAERSGSALQLAINRSNAGYVFQVLGELSMAEQCYERALSLTVPGSEIFNGTVDSLATVRLSQGRFDECEHLLEQIDPPSKRNARATYVYRHVQFTRAQLFIRRGEFGLAEKQLEAALGLARAAQDPILATLVKLEQARLLLMSERGAKVRRLLEELAPDLAQRSADVYARYQELLGLATKTEGTLSSYEHVARARRIYLGLHNAERLADCEYPAQEDHSNPQGSAGAADRAVQSLASVLTYFRHSEFVARELADLLFVTGQFESIAVLSRDHGRDEQILLHMGRPLDMTGKSLERIRVGDSDQTVIEMVVSLKDRVSALATLHATRTIVARCGELRAAKEDRDKRTTTWPIEELPTSRADHVISGHMREQMMYAQRVARTNVNVLITGESGTGKEILARAIHDFSDRAQKPFVPFNCSAVPRDLLESQLFGHRKGAFTGADRDQLGLIRSADGGTLFLDEIGDMSLDLQPKLLRFLESGEISPLGEPSPFTVSVRVVAATNAQLEDAVRDGKFREDLFYRLNVVRLSLKPLRERRDEIPGMVNAFVAAAAREHKKGHLQVSEDTMERLLLYRWPGNVRQLQNEIRRMVALAEPNATIEPRMISPAIIEAMPDLRHVGPNGRELAIPLHDKLLPTLSKIEYEMVKAALREHQGRLDPAAKSLGISRKGLYLKRQRLGL